MKKTRTAEATSLLLEQEAFRRIYETNLVGLSLTDFDGHFLHANDETLRIIGYERRELEAGKINWKALTPLEHLPKDLAAVHEMQTVGHCAPFEKEYIRKDGTRVPVLLAFSLVQDTLAFGTIIDLTRHKELLRTQPAGDARLALAVIDNAHRINNQLAVTLMNAELAFATATNEQVRNHLAEIIASARETLQANRELVREAKADRPAAPKSWSKRARVYRCKTTVGVFTIAPDLSSTERWALSIGAKILGSYDTPVLAADAVVNRSTGFSDWDNLPVHAPEDLEGWEPV